MAPSQHSAVEAARKGLNERHEKNGPLYSFAGFTLDPGRALLYRGTINLPLRPKSFDVLHYLVRHPQQLVPREELFTVVWPDVVVTDDSLTQCMVDIRKALGDEQRGLVRTLPRRGYLLDTPVRVAPSGETADASVAAVPTRPPKTVKQAPRWLAYSATLCIVVVATVGWKSGVWPSLNPTEAFSIGASDNTGDAAETVKTSTPDTPDAVLPGLAARELFKRGKLFYSRRMEGDILRAQRNFEAALQQDPNFAAAWVSLAAVANVRSQDYLVDQSDRLPREEAVQVIRHALQRALELDPQHPEALMRMVRFSIAEGDTPTAFDSLGEALLNGNDSDLVQAMLGGFAQELGDLDLALPFLRRAVALDPLSTMHRANLAHALFCRGELVEAEAIYREAQELSPGLATKFAEWLAWIEMRRGRYDSAREQVIALPPGPARDQLVALLHYQNGDVDAASQLAERLEQYPAMESAYRLATLSAVRGDPDEAFRWLNEAGNLPPATPYRWRMRPEYVRWRTSPFLESLHDDPRWAGWQAQMEQTLYTETDHQMRDMLRHYRAGGPLPSRQLASQ